ncbi:glycosyltransferase family 2 protein [Catenovulum sediminis]|uniref:Glycosyltransferase n=1 Tax=Catenovulum sediminis TaxID=1740262 RepID=A0ABV1RK17_9ALTE
MNQKGLVSVVLPVYNGERFLSEAIESILRQSYPNFELIVINDGSIDGTGSILSKYLGVDSRVKVIEQENKGIVSALNEGISRSKGEYIARMDADDIAYSNRLEEQVNFLERNSDYVLVGSFYKILGTDKLVTVPCGDLDCRALLLFTSCLAHPTAMFRRSTIAKHKLCYDKNLQYVEDYDLWVRIARFGKIGNVPKALLAYRLHGNQITQTKKDLIADRYLNVVLQSMEGNGFGHLYEKYHNFYRLVTNTNTSLYKALVALLLVIFMFFKDRKLSNRKYVLRYILRVWGSFLKSKVVPNK